MRKIVKYFLISIDIKGKLEYAVFNTERKQSNNLFAEFYTIITLRQLT